MLLFLFFFFNSVCAGGSGVGRGRLPGRAVGMLRGGRAGPGRVEEGCSGGRG